MQLNFQTAGDRAAPPVLLCHSLGTSLEAFAAQRRALEPEHFVVSVDLRGHGGSAAPPGPYTLGDLAGDFTDTLDSIGLDRVDIAGISLGAMSAIWLAAHRPERVDRLATICAAARLDGDIWRSRAATARDVGLEEMSIGSPTRWFSPTFYRQNPAIVAEYSAGILRTDREGYAGCCEALAQMDLFADLPRVVAETLVISGEDDTATPPEDGEAIAASIPNAGYVLVEHAAHLAIVEQPEEISRLLVEHFRAGR